MLEKDPWNQNLGAWNSAYLTGSPGGSEASQGPTTAVTGLRNPGEQGLLFHSLLWPQCPEQRGPRSVNICRMKKPMKSPAWD